ncbi:MAG: TolC family protein [Gammaproteobacteria bacterium]|nr:TolC family protein [Gammaproteobacteria bacterium]
MNFRHPRLAPIAIDLSQPLSEEAVGVLAVLASPEAKALRARQGVAEAQVFAAGLLPDPQLSLGADFPVSALPGLVTAYNAGLNWAIASLVTRPVAIRIARAQAEQIRNDVAWQEWLLANQARLLARRIGFLEQQRVVADQAAETTARLLAVTRFNVTSGDATVVELGLRQVGYLDALDRASGLARDLDKTRLQLNQVMGTPPGQRIVLAPFVLSDLPKIDATVLFARAQKERLDLRALEAGYAAQEESVHRAVLGQFPGVGIGLNAARDTGDVRTLGPAITLDIPLFNRNRGVIAVATATREQVSREYTARLQQTRGDIAALVTDLGRLTEARQPLLVELPDLARNERVLRDAVSSGDATLVSYEAVRASLLDKQLKLLVIESTLAEQQIALQVSVGAALLPGPEHDSTRVLR